MAIEQNQIERAFQGLVDHYAATRKPNKATGIETVLRWLAENQQKIWWWSWEFVGKENLKGGYLSHRAPARASDLALHYPHLVEHRKIGRFAVYRLRTENMNQVKEFLHE